MREVGTARLGQQSTGCRFHPSRYQKKLKRPGERGWVRGLDDGQAIRTLVVLGQQIESVHHQVLEKDGGVKNCESFRRVKEITRRDLRKGENSWSGTREVAWTVHVRMHDARKGCDPTTCFRVRNCNGLGTANEPSFGITRGRGGRV